MKLILASGSPRRKEILGKMGYEFECLTSDADETLPAGTPPETGVEILARRKGEAVLPLVGNETAILSSDTLVELDGKPLGKPTDPDDARRMLRYMSGRTHTVRTGIAVRIGEKCVSGVASADVTFRELTDGEIDAYVATGEPLDKAGAYGIQGRGGALVASYSGDFDTIMGLSSALTRDLFIKIGFEG